MVLIVGWWFLGYLLPGPAALHALRLATLRHDGFLAQLSAGDARVSRSGLASLVWWARALRATTAFFVLVLAGVFLGLLAAMWGLLLTGVGFLLHSVVFFPVLFAWWYSLKVASALVDVPIAEARHNARAEAKWMRESGEPMDAQRWKALLEQPVLRLAHDVLPTLSNGWGPSLGLAVAGLVCLAVGAIVFFSTAGLISAGTPAWLLVVILGIMGGSAVLPFLLAVNPAAASSKCVSRKGSMDLLLRLLVFLKVA